jgi:hypothetical protein
VDDATRLLSGSASPLPVVDAAELSLPAETEEVTEAEDADSTALAVAVLESEAVVVSTDVIMMVVGAFDTCVNTPLPPMSTTVLEGKYSL